MTNTICPTLDVADREITEKDILNLREIDDLEAADIYDARVRRLERQNRRSFIEMGMICLEISDRELWKKLVSSETNKYFHSFDAYMLSALNVSRSSAYSAMKAVRDLKEVPAEDLLEMPRCNAMTLSGLSTAVKKDPQIITFAKEKSEEEFIDEVSKRYPDQHIEAKQSVRLKTDKSSRLVFDKAVEAMMILYDAENREQAIEFLCTRFLSEDCEVEEYAMLTNELALEEVKLSRKRTA